MLHILTTLACILALIPGNMKPKKLTEEDRIAQTASEAFFYGYPLVIMETTKNVMTNVQKPGDGRAPVNQFYHSSKLVDASYHDVVSPNNDTLYSTAWLDLQKEPLILHIPDSEGRYFLVPILDAWTNVIASPGTRTTGNKGGDFAIVGPNWSGEIPDGIQIIRSPTHTAWIIGRMQTTGPQDYAAVNKWQEQLTLIPLSSYGKPYSPPTPEVNPKIDMTQPPAAQVSGMDAAAYFTFLNQALVLNPPGSHDSPGLLDKFSKIGVGAKETFDLKKYEDTKQTAITHGYLGSQALIKRIAAIPSDRVNGWDFLISNKIGNFGTDYMLRAKTAYIGLGANLTQDAVYGIGTEDENENPLSGKDHYVIHFDKDKTPPAKAFWSITMYNDKHYFVDNPLNRYAIHDKDKLEFNPDGSLDIFLQKEEPAEKKNNWLPAPEGEFSVILRIYWPDESVLNGSWKPPFIKKAQ